MNLEKSKVANHLINEKSPYLLQHAYNPVNWYPWSEEAFARARSEDKPIFLSIGYSTCHWCHVMERESFEDWEVADLLNEHFISIKVDKEERPEVDAIYMKVCQMMTGSGGWPLTILMTPEQKPFYACTYLPKRSTDSMIGLMNLLNATIRVWQSDQDRLIRSGEEITDILAKEYQTTYSVDGPAVSMLQDAALYLKEAFDSKYGGFGGAPKFPTPHNLLFLLRYSSFYDEPEVMHMVEKTLEGMYRGGIYDHIGGGFSRYSTDNKWLVPHFEKMLYDNALLVITYLEAYEKCKNTIYLEVVENTLAYVEREMMQEEGGFSSAQDADSDGVEGKYYTFTPGEIEKVLGSSAGAAFNTYYGIREGGNFEGKSIPNLLHDADIKLDKEQLSKWRMQVYEYRAGRIELKKDDKVLTSWNALMITAFAKAYAILQKPAYLECAQKAYQFIETHLRNKDGRLLIRYRQGESIGLANIDDYSFLLMAQLQLYEATFELEYLKAAQKTASEMIGLFWDVESGGFYFYGTDAKQLIARPKEVYDGAIPSGNSVATYCLCQLARVLDEERLKEVVKKQMKFMAGIVKENPSAYTFSLCAFLLELHPAKSLICVTWDEQAKAEILREVHDKYNPHLLVLFKTMENEDELEEMVEYTKDYKMVGGQNTFYICTESACLPPINEVGHIHSML